MLFLVLRLSAKNVCAKKSKRQFFLFQNRNRILETFSKTIFFANFFSIVINQSNTRFCCCYCCCCCCWCCCVFGAVVVVIATVAAVGVVCAFGAVVVVATVAVGVVGDLVSVVVVLVSVVVGASTVRVYLSSFKECLDHLAAQTKGFCNYCCCC